MEKTIDRPLIGRPAVRTVADAAQLAHPHIAKRYAIEYTMHCPAVGPLWRRKPGRYLSMAQAERALDRFNRDLATMPHVGTRIVDARSEAARVFDALERELGEHFDHDAVMTLDTRFGRLFRETCWRWEMPDGSMIERTATDGVAAWGFVPAKLRCTCKHEREWTIHHHTMRIIDHPSRIGLIALPAEAKYTGDAELCCARYFGRMQDAIAWSETRRSYVLYEGRMVGHLRPL